MVSEGTFVIALQSLEIADTTTLFGNRVPDHRRDSFKTILSMPGDLAASHRQARSDKICRITPEVSIQSNDVREVLFDFEWHVDWPRLACLGLPRAGDVKSLEIDPRIDPTFRAEKKVARHESAKSSRTFAAFSRTHGSSSSFAM
jgi:hypothetical protein